MNQPFDRIGHILNVLLQFALTDILVIVFLLVILRYVFDTTIIGGNEATLVAFVYVSLIAAAIALRDDEHIAVRYFVDQMPAGIQAGIAIARCALLAIMNLLLLVYAFVWIQRTGAFLMPAMGLPQWVAQISVPIGCGLGFGFCCLRLRASLLDGKSRVDSQC